MRTLRLYLLLLMLLMLFAGFISCSEDDEVDGAGYPDNLTIMTYNVEDFAYNVNNEKPNSDDSTTAYDGVAQILADNDVGVVCFQETQEGSSRADRYGDGSLSSQGDVTGFNTAVQALIPEMRYYAFSIDGGFRRDYLSVWSRYPLYDITSIKPPTMLDPATGIIMPGYRPILRFRIRYRGKDVWFYNMHLKSNAGGVIEQNMAKRRAQSWHLARYIIRNHDPEHDLIVVLGDMNTMPEDYDGSGNSTIDYLCLKYDNPFNSANDFTAVNLKHIGAITNSSVPTVEAATPGTTHPGDSQGFADATFDHILLSPALYDRYYVSGSIKIIKKWDKGDNDERGYADHLPVMLKLQFTNNQGGTP